MNNARYSILLFLRESGKHHFVDSLADLVVGDSEAIHTISHIFNRQITKLIQLLQIPKGSFCSTWVMLVFG